MYESKKEAGRNLYLCFVEFDNMHQATIALRQMNGYRIDPKVAGEGIKISFSKSRPRPRASSSRP